LCYRGYPEGGAGVRGLTTNNGCVASLRKQGPTKKQGPDQNQGLATWRGGKAQANSLCNRQTSCAKGGRPGLLRGGGFFGVPFHDGLAEGFFKAVFGATLLDEGLDLDQSGQLGGGGTQGGEQAQAGVDVVDVRGKLKDAADDFAQGGDLLAKVIVLHALDGFDLVGFEVAGVEAVLESVEVAGLRATLAASGLG
jgi:hypothetical protein